MGGSARENPLPWISLPGVGRGLTLSAGQQPQVLSWVGVLAQTRPSAAWPFAVPLGEPSWREGLGTSRVLGPTLAAAHVVSCSCVGS